jgi:hypothetical protein
VGSGSLVQRALDGTVELAGDLVRKGIGSVLKK